MKKTKFILLSVLCSFLAFGMTSCDDDAKDDDYQKEFIQFDNVTLTAGSTQEKTAYRNPFPYSRVGQNFSTDL